DGHGKTFILRSVNHFGSLTCWKVQPRPNLSFLAEAVMFSFNICWYLMESMIPCILTRCPGPLEEKQPHNIKDPPPYFTLGMRRSLQGRGNGGLEAVHANPVVDPQQHRLKSPEAGALGTLLLPQCGCQCQGLA